MRSLGEFFGHVWRGVKTDPSPSTRKMTVRKHVEEEGRGEVTLRRTTIDEIEIRLPSRD